MCLNSSGNHIHVGIHTHVQPRSQGLRGETVTKTLVKFVLVRHNRIQLYCNTVVSHCACDFFY